MSKHHIDFVVKPIFWDHCEYLWADALLANWLMLRLLGMFSSHCDTIPNGAIVGVWRQYPSVRQKVIRGRQL